MKATLWCHVHISRFANDTAATNTIPGNILPVLSWVLGRRMLVSHSQPILPYVMLAKVQSLVEEHHE